jgi:hypothetical protein
MPAEFGGLDRLLNWWRGPAFCDNSAGPRPPYSGAAPGSADPANAGPPRTLAAGVPTTSRRIRGKPPSTGSAPSTVDLFDPRRVGKKISE